MTKKRRPNGARWPDAPDDRFPLIVSRRLRHILQTALDWRWLTPELACDEHLRAITWSARGRCVHHLLLFQGSIFDPDPEPKIRISVSVSVIYHTINSRHLSPDVCFNSFGYTKYLPIKKLGRSQPNFGNE